MNRREITEILTDLKVVAPCPIKWETMTGDEQKRFCSQCNLNVHNLSAMSAREAVAVVKRSKTERTCVFFRRKADGTIAVDNCPQQLKMVRNKLFSSVAIGLMCVALGIYWSATPDSVPTIAGAATEPSGLLDPRFGLLDPRNYGKGAPFDWNNIGYDQARIIANGITFLSFVIVCIFSVFRRQGRELARRKLLREFAFASIPAIVQVAGQLVLINFGGLGGGGI
jgi:hypothetical protein